MSGPASGHIWVYAEVLTIVDLCDFLLLCRTPITAAGQPQAHGGPRQGRGGHYHLPCMGQQHPCASVLGCLRAGAPAGKTLFLCSMQSAFESRHLRARMGHCLVVPLRDTLVGA